jgi:DNA-binding MarR family transcriptional regulator
MSSRKRELFDRLVYEVRASQAATDRFDQAVADTLGVNRTDLRCIDVLGREGRLTAGDLAAQSGLTTGAITTVVDRLEKAGYARRVRDAGDRRRVYVELTDRIVQDAGPLYAEHTRLGESLYARYTTEQLELLLEFVQRGREFNERKAGELETALAERKHGPGPGDAAKPA